MRTPSLETTPKLKALKAAGKPYDLVVYPDSDHFMLLFEEGEDGKRTYTSYAPTYHRDMVEAALRYVAAAGSNER